MASGAQVLKMRDRAKTPAGPRKVRMPNPMRSALTREKLLNATIECMPASRSDKEFGARFAELNNALDTRHKAWAWQLAEHAGITDRPAIEAMTQLYSAALRGLAIDLLQPGARAGVPACVELLKAYQNQLLDQLIAKACG